MNRILRVLAAWALLLACAAPAAAQDVTTTGFEVVEAFVAAINAGDPGRALGLLDADAVGLEIAAEEQTLEGVFRFQRWITELIADGVHIDTELLEVYGDGSIVVTLERTRSDTIPAVLAPLHGTGTYFVRGGRLAALTRVMLPAHRDAWMASLFVGRWRCGWYAWDVSSDGGYVLTFTRDGSLADSGRFEVVDGAVRFVSDEASTICGGGEEGTYTLAFAGVDRFLVRKLDDACDSRAPDGRLSINRVVDD